MKLNNIIITFKHLPIDQVLSDLVYITDELENTWPNGTAFGNNGHTLSNLQQSVYGNVGVYDNCIFYDFDLKDSDYANRKVIEWEEFIRMFTKSKDSRMQVLL